ncbi:Zn-ribbon domain-containing OB-fold protein [Pseudomonas monteilii]|uniref:Nucleotide-binding protein n=1 Tax=Pseudomonas monteilii TaxID=76759 RepID=A0A399M837_9PSED|nr:OB-fold domain-containing protein [Pseudomonas monteilii]RII77419.1 nucleotide-binding protein [Pseudomonas monteilii]
MNTSLWSSDAPARLFASRHRVSGELVFPPVSVYSPLAEQYDVATLASEGALYSYTIINPSPKSGLQPFALGYVDLPGPARLFGRVNGKRRPEIGDVCRVLPDDTYGYVFELVEDGQ